MRTDIKVIVVYHIPELLRQIYWCIFTITVPIGGFYIQFKSNIKSPYLWSLTTTQINHLNWENLVLSSSRSLFFLFFTFVIITCHIRDFRISSCHWNLIMHETSLKNNCPENWCTIPNFVSRHEFGSCRLKIESSFNQKQVSSDTFSTFLTLKVRENKNQLWTNILLLIIQVRRQHRRNKFHWI